ncbi:MAG TPA: hypothetical protein VEC57_14205 [Candidatus Limnocylindrales bacterium]|nr:hypothetical protein [Candidatus Limnocylindrales bacterium]
MTRAAALAVAGVLAVAAAAAPSAFAGDTPRERCDVAFVLGALPGSTTLTAIDFVVSYERPKIFWKDPMNQIHCVGLPQGSAVAASDNLVKEELTVAYSSATGVIGGTPLVRCDVYVPPGDTPEPSDFPQITVTQATDAGGTAIDPAPVMLVGQIRCGAEITTTTSSTTTSSHPTLTTTTTTLEPETCSVLLRLDTAGSFRRVSFELGYEDAGGRLAGNANVVCHNQTSAQIGIDENKNEQTVSFNLVSLQAFTGPRDLVECDFVPTHFLGDADDFDVLVLAASDANNVPITGTLPDVSASHVMCPSLTTTTTAGPTTTNTTVTTTTGEPLCGDADNSGEVQASDALAALREAVGLTSPCTLARCDTDSSGVIQASDALRILKAAVGADVTLDCPT